MKSFVLICLCVGSIWAVPFVQRKPVPIKQLQGGRIVGGDVAAARQFPWQVAVYFDTPDGTFFCGGALIHPQWILTSGHCTYHATVFTIHLGANSLVTDDTHRVTLGETYKVVHPLYDPNSLENDIGLLRIDTPIELSEFIRPIALPTGPIAGDEVVTVSGWGASGDWDGVENDLHFVNLKTITNSDCQNVYGEVVTPTMLCAVGPTIEGTCNGDNGSPLIQEVGGRPVHVGIVSFTSSSGCETDHPSGYTRTSSFLTWINSVIGSQSK